MNAPASTGNSVTIRPFQRRDLEAIEQLCREAVGTGELCDSSQQIQKWQGINRWYGVLKALSLFPNPLQHLFYAYVAEQGDRVRGLIQVSPFNRTRSTWRVDQVLVSTAPAEQGSPLLSMDIGSQLLRHCFQAIWEARTWLIEANINDKDILSLYRHNGFQPLANLTYWSIAPELLQGLAEREPDLPNLLPVGNADAGLLHQLDTVSMPPLVRQVFDRNTSDFKTSLVGAVIDTVKHRVNRTETIQQYVFEPQRKAAIGYFQIEVGASDCQSHIAQLTVHPAYTWLYPELLAQMARVVKDHPTQPIQLTSSDYQPEREEYLERLGATRTEHTMLMSRSVWHKVRESKFVSLEGLQLAEVLQGFQPARKPVPGRFSLDSFSQPPSLDRILNAEETTPPKEPLNGHSKPTPPQPDDED